MSFKSKSITIEKETPIIPFLIDNSKEIKQVAVFLPTGATGRVSLRNVNEILPFYNRPVGGELGQGQLANNYIKVEARSTDIEGYIELDNSKDFINKQITISLITK